MAYNCVYLFIFLSASSKIIEVFKDFEGKVKRKKQVASAKIEFSYTF